MGDVNLEALTAMVEKVETVTGSAIALISGFAAEVEAHKDDPIAIQALVDRVNAKATELGDAVVANTPSVV